MSDCTECGTATEFACSDCAINSGGRRVVSVCTAKKCRDAHERRENCTPQPRRPR